MRKVLYKGMCFPLEKEMSESESQERARLFVELIELDGKGITPQVILSSLLGDGLWLAKLLPRKDFGHKNPNADKRPATKFDDFAEIYIARCGDKMLRLFCHVAVTENGSALRFVPKKYRDDLYEIAVRNHPKMIRLVPIEKRTSSMYEICARHGKSTYMFFSKDERTTYGIDKTKEYRELYDANHFGYLTPDDDVYEWKKPNGIDKFAKCKKELIAKIMSEEGRYKGIDIFSLLAENPFCIKHYGFPGVETNEDVGDHIMIKIKGASCIYKVATAHLKQIYSLAIEKNVFSMYFISKFYYYKKFISSIGDDGCVRGPLPPDNKYSFINKFITGTRMEDEEVTQLMKQSFSL